MSFRQNFEKIFQESKFTDEELRNIFEETISEKSELRLASYRNVVYPENKKLQKVLSKKGEFEFLKTSGTGYTQWILYHTLSGHLVFILRSPGFIWNWNWKNLNYEEIRGFTVTSKL
jgi:hypothetical protein